MKLPVLTATENALQNSTTVYRKSIRPAPDTPIKSTGLRVLKNSKGNTKLTGGLGSRITKGIAFFRGKHLYNLTLTERATCPSTCEQWNNCYGNNMPFAHRYTPGPELHEAISADLEVLDRKHPEGIIVRLHILGDFYSVEYVEFWMDMVRQYENLGIYGYTHRRHGTDIGDSVAKMVSLFAGRVSILRSDRMDDDDPLPGAYTVKVGTDPNPDVVVCPEQTHETVTCLSCGLCFNGRTSVQFLEH